MLRIATKRSIDAESRRRSEEITKGLDELKKEGWLSEKEYEAFSKALA
jgi:hypothetical protein